MNPIKTTENAAIRNTPLAIGCDCSSCDFGVLSSELAEGAGIAAVINAAINSLSNPIPIIYIISAEKGTVFNNTFDG